MGEITISKELLLDAVDKIITTCERPTSVKGQKAVPHFFYIRLDGFGDKLRLSAHNMLRQIEVMTAEVSQHEPFCLGVMGENFFKLLKVISDETVTLKYENGLTIRTLRGWYNLATLSRDRFPDIEVIPKKDWQEVNYEDLFDSLQRVIYCSGSGHDNRSFTKAVSVTNDFFYCTDGARLSVYPNRHIRCKKPFLLPVESVKSYASLFQDKDPCGYVSADNLKIYFSKKGVYATSSLCDGPVPNHRSVTPDGVCMKASLKKSGITEPLKRLALFSKSISQSHVPVELDFSQGSVGLSLINSEFQSEAREVVDCLYDGPVTKMAVNIKHLYQAVKSVKEETVVVELRGNNYPIVITEEKGEHKNVIIPRARENIAGRA